jgi:hypothetical protein
MWASGEVDELPIDYLCASCGRPLGERFYSTPLYSETERVQSGSYAVDILNLFLPDRYGNANQGAESISSKGVKPNPLCIVGVRGPRTGPRVWRAEIRDTSVLVHFSCPCGRGPKRLTEIVTETQAAIDRDPRPHIRVMI